MHSKAKGNIGEMAVAKDLMLKGYSVFYELGDLSKIDLIALKNKKTFKVQVKTKWNTTNGTCSADLRSSGPGYSYKYTEDDIDIIACYAADRDIVFYVNVKDIISNNTRGLTIRLDKPKNNQTKGINLLENYLDINV